MKTKEKYKKHKGEGHRGRLRERFMQSGLDAFLDYEIVELLLTLGTPQQDCKDRAKELIKKFHGLRGVLDASVEDLQEVKGIGQINPFGLKLFQAVAERYERERIKHKIVLNSPKSIADYLREKIGRKKKEHFVILCLDVKNNLVKISNISMGILDENLVHPREVFRDAIQANSARVIVAHNHPSGDTEPSDEDLLITKRLYKSGNILGIEVLDHVIVSNRGFYSLKEKNHI
ncbi:MAG: DNA repair protein RadC [Candidatus Doudnabacteria bacterium]|nr:DNA repair protein RadC [Candidatus Doudnabacteria bacterium]